MRRRCSFKSWAAAICHYGLGLALVLAAGCASAVPPPPPSQATGAAAKFHEGQIVETSGGHSVSPDQLFVALQGQDVVYLGEEHHNRFHIDSALLVLERLVAAGRHPVLAMEMFGWDNQPALDRYVSSEDLTREEFLNQIHWPQSWGGPFEDYEPLVRFAKEHRLRLVALNPPKAVVRAVATRGLDQARRGAEMTRWGLEDETIVDDPAYREKILQQLRACHDGGSEAMYRTMYEASMVRDEGMAKVIAAELQRIGASGDPSAGPVVSYTGGGHVQFHLPVPKRVARRIGAVRQATIYMTSYAPDRMDDIQSMISERIADYLWLTSVSAHGLPRRCR
ncbi:MAG TPA: ChaN family lipoprotein [Nitrospira sp.]|nr:ChaN family lipoprotein [Nitrospira sp.]